MSLDGTSAISLIDHECLTRDFLTVASGGVKEIGEAAQTLGALFRW